MLSSSINSDTDKELVSFSVVQIVVHVYVLVEKLGLGILSF